MADFGFLFPLEKYFGQLESLTRYRLDCDVPNQKHILLCLLEAFSSPNQVQDSLTA